MQNKIYIGEIILENYANFTGEHIFDLRDENGFINQWTVILGNNNTGKTNLLKAIAGLDPTIINFNEKEVSYYPLFLFKERKDRLNSKISIELFNAIKSESEKYFENVTPFFTVKYKFGASYAIDKVAENNFKIYSYGVTRRYSEQGVNVKNENNNSITLFEPSATLINLEDWLLRLFLASKNNDKIAEKYLEKLKEIIKTDLLPEIKDFNFISENTNTYLKFETSEGWFQLKELAFGYQSMLSWIFDLAKKMFERYPDSENPLKEAAVVLVDEIDLHLHPEWQRNIIKFLSDIFVQTQFIVTTHSPFVVQSFDKIKLFVLNKTENGIEKIEPDFKTYNGWTIEEILKDIMNLEDKTKSDLYRNLLNDFDNALDTDDYEKGLNAYNKLLEILNPETSIRKILEIKFSQLVKND